MYIVSDASLEAIRAAVLAAEMRIPNGKRPLWPQTKELEGRLDAAILAMLTLMNDGHPVIRDHITYTDVFAYAAPGALPAHS